MKLNKATGVAILLVCCMLLGACGNGEKITALKRPVLDETLSPTPSLEEAEVVFNVDDDVFEKTLSIYSKVNNKKDELATVKARFGFEGTEGVRYGDTVVYTNDEGAQLNVYDSGTFEYSMTVSNEGITLSEKELEEKAEAYLAELNISLDGFERAGKFVRTTGTGELKTIDRMTLCYEKKVDGYGIIGASRIMVGFANDEVYTISLAYSDREKAFDIVSRSRDEVAESFIESVLDIKCDDEVTGGKATHLEVTGVEIVYLDDSRDEEQPHIIPMFRVSGKVVIDNGAEADFKAILNAVPDQYFAED